MDTTGPLRLRSIAVVQERYPDARLEIVGSMFCVICSSSGRRLSRLRTDPVRAWISARDFISIEG